MASYALIKNGKVDNVASIEPDDLAAVGKDGLPVLKLDADEVKRIDGLQVGIGYLYDGVNFTKPVPPEPKPVEKTTEERLAAIEEELKALKAAK